MTSDSGVRVPAPLPVVPDDAPLPPPTFIRPTTGWVPLRLGELWAYRELLFFFIWRDVKVRYKQTALGAAWAVIQPLFTMITFSIFFGRLARIPSDGVPYPLFAYAALVPWTFFANGLGLAGNSLVEHERMITKIYFPRLLIPLSAVLSGLVDFCISFVVLCGLLLYYRLGRRESYQTLRDVLADRKSVV
jgi:lipopolysaccharide transport system permease protein